MLLMNLVLPARQADFTKRTSDNTLIHWNATNRPFQSYQRHFAGGAKLLGRARGQA